jgi:cyclic lactone autoinducer peptide
MQKSINFFSDMLLKIFKVRLNVSCMSFYGEPDCPEEILK